VPRLVGCWLGGGAFEEFADLGGGGLGRLGDAGHRFAPILHRPHRDCLLTLGGGDLGGHIITDCLDFLLHVPGHLLGGPASVEERDQVVLVLFQPSVFGGEPPCRGLARVPAR